MCGRGFSRLLSALHCSLHPCRDVVCSYLGRGRGSLTGGILPLEFLLLLLLLLGTVLPVVSVVLPAAGHPCCRMGAPCWACHCIACPWSASSPAPPGSCFLNHGVPRLPEGLAVLACQEVLHWLQRWLELPGISWMNKQGQLAKAEGQWVQCPLLHSQVSQVGTAQPESCKKSGASHVEIFTSSLPSYTIFQQSFSSSWDYQEQGLALQQQAVSGSWDVCVKCWGVTGAASRAIDPLPPAGISQYKYNVL